MRSNYFFLLVIFICLFACGESGLETDSDESENSESNEMLTAKLIGTPFEGLTTGDDLWPPDFYCGVYRTETIASFPIKIFAAFFTANEEEAIQEGISLANDGIGFEAYQLTDEWSDDVRVIYKVEVIQYGDSPPISSSRGHANYVLYYFNESNYSERIVTDWTMELRTNGISPLGVAHELGHNAGLQHDCLIDYENNVCAELEEDSIMSGDSLGRELTSFNFMMSMQGQIMLNHLNDASGTLDTGECPEE